MKIIQMSDYRKSDVTKTLSDLLEESSQGKILGLMYVKHERDGAHQAGWTGDYRHDPNEAVYAADQALHQLRSYAARKMIDPMTASDFQGR